MFRMSVAAFGRWVTGLSLISVTTLNRNSWDSIKYENTKFSPINSELEKDYIRKITRTFRSA